VEILEGGSRETLMTDRQIWDARIQLASEVGVALRKPEAQARRSATIRQYRPDPFAGAFCFFVLLRLAQLEKTASRERE
jgi:hypothetical protein